MDADRGDNGNGEGGGRGGGRGRGGGLGGGLGTGGEEEREREGGEDGRDLQTVLQLIRSRQNQQSPQPPALPPPQTQLGSPTQFSLSQSLSLDDQQPGPSGLGRLQPVPGGLAQLQPVPAHFSQLQPVPGGLGQLQPVPAHVRQLQPVPSALNVPVVPQTQQYRNTGRSQAMDDGSTSSSQDTPTQQPPSHPRRTSHPFHITQSQDPFVMSTTQDDQHLTFDLPSVGDEAAPSTSAVPVPALVAELREQQRIDSEQQHKAFLATLAGLDREREDREREVVQAQQQEEEEEEEETEQSQSQSESEGDQQGVGEPANIANVPLVLPPVSCAEAKQSRVPGSTESSQSSDEFTIRRRRIRRELSETNVPEHPPSSLATVSRSEQRSYQEVARTTSSDGSSSDQGIVPTSERKVRTDLPVQKVPKLTSSQKRRIQLRSRSEGGMGGVTLASIDEDANEGSPMEADGDGDQEEREREGRGEEEGVGESGQEGGVSQEDESVTSATPQRQVLSQQTPGGDTGVSMSGSGVGVSGSSVGTGRVIPLTSGTTASQGASVDSATASQSEAEVYLPDPNQQRVVRRPSELRCQATTNVPTESPTDEPHPLQSMTVDSQVVAGSPDWGASTDATSEYPSVTTASAASRSSGPSSGDSASFTMTSSGERRSESASFEGSDSSQSQPTTSQTIPISSTPQDDVMMPPPPPPHTIGFLGLQTPSKKQSSDGTTSSTSTLVSSSSGGLVEKTTARVGRIHSEESITTSQLLTPLPPPHPHLSPNHSPEQSPLVRESQTPEDCPRPEPGGLLEVIPGTPPGQEVGMEVSPSQPTGSQELFIEEAADSQEELANQAPSWYKELSNSPTSSQEVKGGSSGHQGRKRAHSKLDYSSSSSSSEQTLSSPCHPPPKRKRSTVSGSSSASRDRSVRGGSALSSSNLGPSAPAQSSSFTSKPGSVTPGDSSSQSTSKNSGGSSGSSSSSHNVSSSSSSGMQTASSEILSSSGPSSGGAGEGLSGGSSEGDGAGGKEREGQLSGGSSGGDDGAEGKEREGQLSGGSSGGDGAGGKEREGQLSGGSSGGDSGAGGKEREGQLSGGSSGGDGAGGEEREGDGMSEEPQCDDDGASLQRKEGIPEPSVESDMEYSESVSLLVNQVDSTHHLQSPTHPTEAIRSDSPSISSQTVQLEHQFLDGKLAMAVADSHLPPSDQPVVLIDTIEESLPMSASVQPVGSESEKLQASSWHLHLSASSTASRPSDSHALPNEEKPIAVEVRSESMMDAGEDTLQFPGSPELLEGDGVENMEASPEIALQGPVVAMTPDRQQASNMPKVPPAKLAGDENHTSQKDEPNEVEYSTQSSFALHLSQSQSFATPVSVESPFRGGFRSPSQTEPDATPLKAVRILKESLQEIEEHEKEFVNLREKSGYLQDPSQGLECFGSHRKPDPLDNDSEKDKERATFQGATATSCVDKVADIESNAVNQLLLAVDGSKGNSAAEEEAGGGSEADTLLAQGADLVGGRLGAQDGKKLFESEVTTCVRPDANRRSDITKPSIVIARVISSSPSQEGISMAACGDIVRSEVKDGESAEHSLEQLTLSGTPFQFHLPQGGLLRPRLCITPPSQRPHRSRSSSTSPDSITPPLRPPFPRQTPHHPSSSQEITNAASQSEKRGASLLSPSNLDPSLFRPISQSDGQQSQREAEDGQVQKPPELFQVSKTAEVEELHSPSMLETEEEQVESHAESVIKSAITSEAQRSQAGTARADSESAVVQESEPSAPQDPHSVPTASEAAMLQTSAAQTSAVKLSTNHVGRRAKSPSSPRKPLSLRKARSNAVGSKDTSGVLQRRNGSVETRKEANGSTDAGHNSSRFVLGVRSSESQDVNLEEDSQFVLPTVNVPSDSQFVSSESSQFTPANFRIERPPSVDTTETAAHTSRKSSSPPKESIFSNITASRRTPRLLEDSCTRVQARGDPFEFNSQSQNTEVRFVPRRGRKTRTRGAERISEKEDIRGVGGLIDGQEEGRDEDMEVGEEERVRDVPEQRGDRGCLMEASSSQSHLSGDISSQRHRSGLQPLSQVHDDSSLGQRESRQTQLTRETFSPSSDRERLSRSQPSTPTISQPSTSSVAQVCITPTTPLPTCTPPVQFTSPSGIFQVSQLSEFSQQYGREQRRYVLQHVKTYRSVVYHHVVSSEVIEGTKVVEGESKVWQEDTQPQCLEDSTSFRILPCSPAAYPSTQTSPNQQAAAVSVLPTPGLLSHQVTSSRSAGLTTLPHPPSFSLSTAAITTPPLTTPQTSPFIPSHVPVLQSPVSAIPSHPQSPTCTSFTINSPQLRFQPPLPPVRLVQPTSQSGLSTQSSSASQSTTVTTANSSTSHTTPTPIQAPPTPKQAKTAKTATITTLSKTQAVRSQSISSRALDESPLPPPHSPVTKTTKGRKSLSRKRSSGITTPPVKRGVASLKGSHRSSTEADSSVSSLVGKKVTQKAKESSERLCEKLQGDSQMEEEEEREFRTPRKKKASHIVTTPTTNARTKGKTTDDPTMPHVPHKSAQTPSPSKSLRSRSGSAAMESSAKAKPSPEGTPHGGGKTRRGKKGGSREEGEGELEQPGPSKPPAPVVVVGCQVIARWRDGCWYPGTVISEAKSGRLNICFVDEDKYLVSPSNVLPLELVRNDVPVTAMKDEDQELSELNGLFAGFVNSAMDTFRIKVAQGEQQVCGTYRLALPAESAARCKADSDQNKKHDHDSVDKDRRTPTDRKRGRSILEGEDGTPPATKRKKKGCAEELTVVPRHQRKWFDGYIFLLTQKIKDEGHLATPPSEQVDRELVRCQVVNRGGKILDHYGGEKIIHGRFFVLSDTYCRTSKYLVGLGLGVPLVSYDWISECVSKGRIVDHEDFLLPAGLSHETNQVIPWEPRPKSAVLRGTSICLNGSDAFKVSWTRVLKASGAEVVPKLPTTHQLSKEQYGQAPVCDTVICEPTASKQLRKTFLHRSSNSGLKLLSTEWIIQCLINAQRLENYRDYWYDQTV